MIGEDFTFTYSFDNTLVQTGYGPYVDIYFPTSGEDGSPPNPPIAGGDSYDGIKFCFGIISKILQLSPTCRLLIQLAS